MRLGIFQRVIKRRHAATDPGTHRQLAYLPWDLLLFSRPATRRNPFGWLGAY